MVSCMWFGRQQDCFMQFRYFYHLSKKAWLTAIYSLISTLLQQQGLWDSFTPSAAEHPSCCCQPHTQALPELQACSLRTWVPWVPWKDTAFSSLHSNCHEKLQSSIPRGHQPVWWTCKEGASYLVAEPAWLLLTWRESRKTNWDLQTSSTGLCVISFLRHLSCFVVFCFVFFLNANSQKLS